MAREAYRSLYGDLTKLKDDSLLKDPAAGSGDDDETFQLLLAVSDWVDRYCHRRFYPRVQTFGDRRQRRPETAGAGLGVVGVLDRGRGRRQHLQPRLEGRGVLA